MELYDDAWDEDEASSFSIVPRELRRLWSETAWAASSSSSSPYDWDTDGSDGPDGPGPMLFSDRSAEQELRAEMRLSQLWNRCRAGVLTSAEFTELSHLIIEVDGIRGLLCMDCATLDRPNASANWALGDTMLCRGHLRFRLGHAHVEGDGTA